MAFKGIIFYFNGVLWWDGHLQVEAWQRCAVALRGTSLSDHELAIHMHGRTNSHILIENTAQAWDGPSLHGILICHTGNGYANGHIADVEKCFAGIIQGELLAAS